MSSSKWWKCDLQVATPAWEFKFPGGVTYSVEKPEGRKQFLDAYMTALKQAGVEVIALADHNTSSWIDDAKVAGRNHGIIVFPGCEITTNTGADGAHIIIVGDTDKTGQDFDRLIHGPLGFGAEHPPFSTDRGGQAKPGSSSKNIEQILNALPEGYLAIAPHVLTDNGIASSKTANGDIRWRALHHERLAAVDPGDCFNPEGDKFNARFRRRALSDFPRLKDLAFISTSDAYCLEDLGKNFTWIRMGEVNLEALRQAFLDHDSRVLCDWSPKLNDFPEKNPNHVRHAWIGEVELGGQLENSTSPLRVSFHHGLNVVIGGRGSGKSSIVAALRELYVGNETLPKRLKEDADSFRDIVFASAQLKAIHHVQESQAIQVASWSATKGRVTEADGIVAPTAFQVTVISQKELFERAAGDKKDPAASSRNLLALIDNSVGFNVQDKKTVDSYGRRLEDARIEWGNSIRDLTQLKSDQSQLPALCQQYSTIQGQVDAFASTQVKERLARIDARANEEAVLAATKAHIESIIEKIQNIAQIAAFDGDVPRAIFPHEEAYESAVQGYVDAAKKISDELNMFATAVKDEVARLETGKNDNPWFIDAASAREDLKLYKLELDAKGLSTTEFGRLQEALEQTRARIRSLEEREPEIPKMHQRALAAASALKELMTSRQNGRELLLKSIETRSGRLRFKTHQQKDIGPWVDVFRTLAAFRADAYHEDVRKLTLWLWDCPEETIFNRYSIWQQALASADMSAIQTAADLRPAFSQRLEGLDESIRLKLATFMPDDVVEMEFLREDGAATNDSDWQSITRGSPGQRTAAMLAFVLHHGHEPLVLDQPEDDLDSEWISKLVVKELRKSRWHRQLIVISHNANIPVLGDAEQVIALENHSGELRVRKTDTAGADEAHPQQLWHVGPVESALVRKDIQTIMEGGVIAFVKREQKYNNETRAERYLVNK
jgi:DNA repair ATPase RecN